MTSVIGTVPLDRLTGSSEPWSAVRWLATGLRETVRSASASVLRVTADAVVVGRAGGSQNAGLEGRP